MTTNDKSQATPESKLSLSQRLANLRSEVRNSEDPLLTAWDSPLYWRVSERASVPAEVASVASSQSGILVRKASESVRIRTLVPERTEERLLPDGEEVLS